MKPTELLRKIRTEHDALVELLADARSMAADLLAGVLGRERELRALVMAFLSHMEHHFALEEKDLVPLMERAGLWNPERAARFETSHVLQRHLLAEMSRHLRSAGPELARAMLSLADVFPSESELENQDIAALVGWLDLQ